jgi:hypothetical protein
MRQYKQLHDRIHGILLNEWDPIGVREQPLAHNEYDAYIPGIIGLLRHAAARPTLAEHLHRLETIEMGLPGDHARSRHVAAALMAMYTQFRAS